MTIPHKVDFKIVITVATVLLSCAAVLFVPLFSTTLSHGERLKELEIIISDQAASQVRLRSESDTYMAIAALKRDINAIRAYLQQQQQAFHRDYIMEQSKNKGLNSDADLYLSRPIERHD